MARALVLRSDAAKLPLPDASVDLVVTSPPYYMQRSYEDGGKPLAGQLGTEATPREYLDSLLACTVEWMRVLKPEGSLFVNMGDKYATRYSSVRGGGRAGLNGDDATRDRSGQNRTGSAEKSLLGLPWRYALRCVDELGLILRQDCIDAEDGGAYVWAKVNGLPESAADRCRRAHEYVFHLVKQPCYYSAVDEIREPHSEGTKTGWTRSVGNRSGNGVTHRTFAGNTDSYNSLGKLPGSVWPIASAPLNIPDHIAHARCCGGRKRPGCEDELDHSAAFPPALPRRIILGWSPPGICTACGEGRRPVSADGSLRAAGHPGRPYSEHDGRLHGAGRHGVDGSTLRSVRERVITGYACACTPYTDHPERRRPSVTPGRELGRGHQGNAVRAEQAGSRHHGDDWPERLPVREYHFDRWTPPPARPAVVLDPFGGTGTTALVASVHGRTGISADLSGDYGSLARWRTRDSAERARARGEAPAPLAKRVRADLYGDLADDLDALLEESS